MSRSYDPVRLGAPDGRVAEVDGVTGRRYKATGGGMYEMHPRDARAFKAEGAFTPTIGGPTIRGGYTCPGCGFRAVVRTCSRCGERCETDAERTGPALPEGHCGAVERHERHDLLYGEYGSMDYRTCEGEPASAFVPHESGLGGFMVSATVDGQPVDCILMEYEVTLGTGEIREVGPVRPGPGAVSAEIDRSFRASLARESARRTIYGGRA